ncbi:MAG: sugar ABC transporter permease [Planctomycetota bacterium]|nr:sugar ABC transporter permease [Planctomycetota bacterium]
MAATDTRAKGVVFALPWILGLGIFTLYPFCASIYYSFTDFSVLQAPKWIGVTNFQEIAADAVFWKVLRNTLLYAGLSIPAGLLVSLTLALVLNGVRRGQILYSVIFYLPHLIPGVASAILWMWILNGEFGLLNSALRPVLELISPSWAPPVWLNDTRFALPALVLMGLWGVGQSAFIYLATLQDVPQEMYEAAEIDGATTWQKVRFITIPMISPIIFFNVIMGIIGAFQVFTEPYLMTGGGPDRATYFLPHYIWDHAFRYLRMGYACAMSWILFLIILLLTMVAFRLSKDRVYYAGR